MGELAKVSSGVTNTTLLVTLFIPKEAYRRDYPWGEQNRVVRKVVLVQPGRTLGTHLKSIVGRDP